MESIKDQLRAYYKDLPDYQLIHIATKEASDLKAEALEVINEEIDRRGLPVEVKKGILAQFKEVTPELLNEYLEIVRKQPCPHCGSVSEKLNGILIAEVLGFVVGYRREKKFMIGCPASLRKLKSEASLITAASGWLGFPFGAYYSIRYLIHNYKMNRVIDSDEPTSLLKDFVIKNIGYLEANRDKKNELFVLLKNAN